MSRTKTIDRDGPTKESCNGVFHSEEDRQDYLDACAAADSIQEAIETGEITPFDDFVKEMAL
jgi:hypothetical protein